MKYVLRVKDNLERLQIRSELALAWGREAYPDKVSYSEVLLKALKYYNDNYVYKPREVK